MSKESTSVEVPVEQGKGKKKWKQEEVVTEEKKGKRSKRK